MCPWVPRKDYEAMLRRNDDRDFATMRAEVERVRSDVRALRTWLQRNLDALTLDGDDDAQDVAAAVPVATGGWPVQR